MLLVIGIVLAVALGCLCLPTYPLQGTNEVIEVQAAKGWQSTGLHVSAGDRLTITYISGYWSPWPMDEFDAIGSGGDPRCRCNAIDGVSHAALIGRIGEADPFLVGEEFRHVVGESGVLFLGINDVDLHDNSGELRVLVEIDR